MTPEQEAKALQDLRDFHEDPTVVCTCADCDKKHTCELSYDAYNTHGDCLASK